jgi:hypothetical protein
MAKESPEYVSLYGVLVKGSDLSRLRRIAESLLPLATRDVPREQAKRLAVKSAQHVMVQYRNAVMRLGKKKDWGESDDDGGTGNQGRD